MFFHPLLSELGNIDLRNEVNLFLLTGMCVSAVRRDRMRTQYFMRGRIAAQFFTIAVLAGGAWAISGRRENDSPHDDAIPVAS